MMKTIHWLTLRKFKSKSPDARFEAVKEMVASADPVFLEPLLEALNDEWVGVRAVAAEALGRIGNPSAIPALKKAVNDSERTVRGSAARALEILGASQDVPESKPFVPTPKAKSSPTEPAPNGRSLVDMLIADLGHPLEGPKAIVALAEIGSAAVDPLLAVLERENSWSQQMAIRALGEIRDPRSVDRLTALLRKGSREAAEALGRIGDARAVGPLIDSLVHGNDHMARASAEALGRIGDRRAAEPLIASIARPGMDLNVAAEALGLIGDPQAAPVLTEHITNRNAAIALRRIGPRAMPEVVKRLDDSDEVVRKACAWILARIGDPRAIPHLASRLAQGGHVLRALESLEWKPSKPHEKVSYLLSYGELDAVIALGEDEIQHVITSFDSEDEAIRAAATAVIVKFGSAAVLPLVAALREKKLHVRRRAAAALGAIGDVSAAGPLAASLEEDLSLEAVQSLASLGGSEVCEALLWVLSDPKVPTHEIGPPGRKSTRPVDPERAAAIRALAKHKSNRKKIEAAIVRAIDDDSSVVREAAMESAAAFVDERAIDPLLSLLRDERAFAVDPVSLQLRPSPALSTAIDCLGRVGDARVVAPLIDLLRKPSFSSLWAPAEQAARAILNRKLGVVEDDILRDIVLLDDTQKCQHAEIQGDRVVKRVDAVDCKALKALAAEELARRQPPPLQKTTVSGIDLAAFEPTSNLARDEESSLPQSAKRTKRATSGLASTVGEGSNGSSGGSAPTPAAAAGELLVICSCGARATVSAAFAGRRGKCKECGGTVTVPS